MHTTRMQIDGRTAPPLHWKEDTLDVQFIFFSNLLLVLTTTQHSYRNDVTHVSSPE